MVSAKVFLMKNVLMERILEDRTFDIRAILPILRDFTLFQGEKLLLTLKSGKISKYWRYCHNVKSPTYKCRGEVIFFSNCRKLKIMVGVNAMKNIVIERIFVGRIFDIKAILAIFRDFSYLVKKALF